MIATLPQLQTLDSETILRSDRIKAMQNYEHISKLIIKQQDDYKGTNVILLITFKTLVFILLPIVDL